MKGKQVSTRTRRGIGTWGGSVRDDTASGSRSDVVGEGLGALGGWEPGKESGTEGSPGNVLGTTSGRGVSPEAIRVFQ